MLSKDTKEVNAAILLSSIHSLDRSNRCKQMKEMQHMKQIKHKTNTSFIKYVAVVLSILILLAIPMANVNAQASLSLRYDNKNVSYTSTQVKATYNGFNINMNGTPGIVINDTALVSYKDVFQNSVIKATSSYSSKVITIKKGSKTIKMTLGSKTAYVNGVKKTMDIAPKSVTYKSKNTTKILVPSRFVVESLGYKYTWNNSTKSADITGPMNLYYDGKNYLYSNTKGKVTVNGKSINVSDMPSIIINNTALIRANKVLTSSGIKASYKYQSSNKTLTLVKGSTSIKLTMGSKTAYVNGKKYTMDTAARVVTNKDSKKSYIMVPGSFVITKLGYNYTWNSTSKTSVITNKSSSDATKANTETNVSKDKDYLSMDVNSSLLDEFTYVSNITNNDIQSDVLSEKTNISTITKSMDGANEKFTISASTPFQNISSTYEGTNVIAIKIGNSQSTDTTTTYDNSLVKSIASSYNPTNSDTTVRLYLTPKSAKYSVQLSDDKLSATVTVYNNYISNITAKHRSAEDIVTITGLLEPEAVVTSDSAHVYVDLSYTISAVGDQTKAISSGDSVKGISVKSTSINSVRIAIDRTSDAEYYTSTSGTGLSIIFSKSVKSNYPITIKLPSGITYSKITNQDKYLNKKFIITIPGNRVSYYKSNPVKYNYSGIKSVAVTLNSAGNTDITITCSSILGYKLTDKGSYIGVTVGTPKSIYKNIVVLDAGHGGHDSGASYSGTHEKDIAYKILYTYGKNYFNSQTSNIKVYYTRVDDTFVDLYERAAFAKKVGADLFISLHMNAATPTAKGTEVYYSTDNNKKTSSGLTSKILATEFVNKLSSTLNNYNRGAKSAKFVVVYRNTVPSILIELGFMTNSTDYKNLTNSTYQQNAAKSIYDITASIFKTYPTGR